MGEEDLAETLKTLRDELRLRIHLAGMDARAAFAQIERDAEHVVGSTSRKALSGLIERLERLRHSIPTGGERT